MNRPAHERWSSAAATLLANAHTRRGVRGSADGPWIKHVFGKREPCRGRGDGVMLLKLGSGDLMYRNRSSRVLFMIFAAGCLYLAVRLGIHGNISGALARASMALVFVVFTLIASKSASVPERSQRTSRTDEWLRDHPPAMAVLFVAVLILMGVVTFVV